MNKLYQNYSGSINYIIGNTTYTLNPEQVDKLNEIRKRRKAQDIRLLNYIFVFILFAFVLIVLAIFGRNLIRNYLIASIIIFLCVSVYEIITRNKSKQDYDTWEKNL